MRITVYSVADQRTDLSICMVDTQHHDRRTVKVDIFNDIHHLASTQLDTAHWNAFVIAFRNYGHIGPELRIQFNIVTEITSQLV